MNNLVESYEKCYEEVSFLPQQTNQEELNLFASLIPSKNPMRVLDLGCAEGELALLLNKMGHQVTASDISYGQLLKVGQKSKEEIELIHCDIQKEVNGFEENSFDFIFFMDVIEHLKSPVEALVNIRKILHDKGRLIIHTPNGCHLSRFTWYLRNGVKTRNFKDFKNLGDFHFHLYDYLSLEQTLHFCGFKTSRVIPTTFTLPLLHRFKIFNPVSKRLVQKVPMLGDTLLLECEKCEPIDMDAYIQFLKEKGVTE